jgi:tetratricopeptide (TPR) repeat protein
MHAGCNTRRQAGVALLLLCLAGCADAPQTRALLTTPGTPLPRSAELAGTPFFAQQRYQCGPAALATVLDANGLAVTPGELVAEVYLPAVHGSVFEELAAAARRRGMLAYPLAPRLSDLLAEVADGHPVLVLQNLGLNWLPKRHFAVVIGYDLAQDVILLRSGTLKRRVTLLSTFERTWQRSGSRALVITPPGVVPATAEPLRFLEAARELDTRGNHRAASAAWQAATVRWPDNPLAWMALGNHAFTDGDATLACSAFTRVTRLTPTDPAGWNNLAYSLLGEGCPQAAQAAAECACRLAPGDPNALDTRNEIRRGAHAQDHAHCPPVHCPSP